MAFKISNFLKRGTHTSLLTPHAESALEDKRQSGHWDDVIQGLEHLCTQHADLELEQTLLHDRLDGFAAQSWATPEAAWPPDYKDQFNVKGEFPDIELNALSSETLRSGIFGHGGLIVRGLMSKDMIEPLKANIKQAFEARLREQDDPQSYAGSPWYNPSEKIEAAGPVQFFTKANKNKHTHNGALWAAHSPRNAEALIRYYKHIKLDKILAGYFGEPAALSVRKWVLRIVAPRPNTTMEWHQDGQFLGQGIRTVNMWIALSDCGAEAAAPGLDVVTGNTREIYEVGTEGAKLNWTVGPGIVDKLSEKNPITNPHFRAGDAIFFNHYNLHRTGNRIHNTQERYAVETWFYGASTVPKKQIPLIF